MESAFHIHEFVGKTRDVQGGKNTVANMRTFISVAVLSILLAGCATPLEKIELANEEAAKLQRLAMLKMNESQHITARNQGVGVAGVLAGALGGLVVEMANVERAKKFVQLINENKLFMGPDMVKALQSSLAARGFEVEYLPETMPILMADGETVDYSHISTKADAILSVWFGDTGYVALSEFVDYKPWVIVGVRLIEPRTKKVFYHQVFSAGIRGTNENIENLLGCETPSYANEDALLKDVKGAVDGLKACHVTVARTIAEKLRPQK